MADESLGETIKSPESFLLQVFSHSSVLILLAFAMAAVAKVVMLYKKSPGFDRGSF
ncbi:hypothetical protein N836_23275 [Leptolyngbya sp. Heron Island J]|nr:hypothetical protein N836_23275 [Leptolyngbya sp. Heron Island J]